MLVVLFQLFCIILVFCALISCGKIIVNKQVKWEKKILPLVGVLSSGLIFFYLWFVLGWGH